MACNGIFIPDFMKIGWFRGGKGGYTDSMVVS
jgi:hypothetical protein